MEEKKQTVNVEIKPEQAEGIYANGVIINHSPSEFILDFIRFVPGLQTAKIYARVIMTPPNIQILRDALDQNIKKYEERFDKIKVFGAEQKEIGFK